MKIEEIKKAIDTLRNYCKTHELQLPSNIMAFNLAIQALQNERERVENINEGVFMENIYDKAKWAKENIVVYLEQLDDLEVAFFSKPYESMRKVAICIEKWPLPMKGVIERGVLGFDARNGFTFSLPSTKEVMSQLEHYQRLANNKCDVNWETYVSFKVTFSEVVGNDKGFDLMETTLKHESYSRI